MRIYALALSLTWLAFPQGAAANEIAVDLRGVDPALVVQPSEVMVLGTAHLVGMSDRIDANTVTPLIDQLAAFAPEIITIEAVPGETCELFLAYPSEYPGVFERYCTDVSQFRAESGMSASMGAAHIRGAFHDWPSEPSQSFRRQLAAAFLAANEPNSALVQWEHLIPEERRPADGLGKDSVKFLRDRRLSMNENVQIGVRLAVRLGLERVYAVDDHSADIAFADHGDAIWVRMREIWASGDGNLRPAYAEAIGALEDGRVLEAYRFFNAASTQIGTMNSDFRLAMNDGEEPYYGRIYNSWYQTRNLRMVSNITAAISSSPGSRVLSIVGASHKAYFEAYLDQMHDIELVPAESYLSRSPVDQF